VALPWSGALAFICALYPRSGFHSGRGFGLFVYLRNLYFSFRERNTPMVS
jgi:lipid-A-disaccharide synthase-like uncharacterized protein